MNGDDTDRELADLRAQFPSHMIGTDSITGRVRYIARRRREGTNPHTVVTPDLAELRAALQAG